MSYEHLTLEERYVIYHLKLCKLGLREIGRRLGRHDTIISRLAHRYSSLSSCSSCSSRRSVSMAFHA